MRRRRTAIVVAIAALPSLVVAVVIAGAVGLAIGLRPLGDVPAVDASALEASTTADTDALSQEQLDNAALIVAAGRDLGLSIRDQTIGVMTALGESSLRNIDYGDWETSGVTNPDGSRTTSIGLFQQQDGWGTREQRLDPYTAATLFYRAMIDRVPDRDTVAPTLVAHRTQINKNPEHYARYWPRAIAIVEALTGENTGLTP